MAVPKAELIKLSNEIRTNFEKNNPSISMEGLPAGWLNEQIRKHYAKDNPQTTFQTFLQWRQMGFKVRKGEKAYLVWGKKRKYEEKKPTEENPENTESKNWHPVAYIFASNQVEPIAQQKTA